MKNNKIPCFVLLLSLFVPSSLLFAESLEVTIQFPAPTLVPHGPVFRVLVGDLPSSHESGLPILPFRPLRLLLPYGKKVKGLCVLPGLWQQMSGKVKLATAAPIGPISLRGDRRRRFLKLFPKAPAPKAMPRHPRSTHLSRGVQRLFGYAMVDLNLHPLRYEPGKSRLSYTRSMTVRIDLEDGDAATIAANHANLTGAPDHASKLAALVENAGTLTSYAGKAPRRTGPTIPYLIVTTEALKKAPGPDNLQSFAAFLESRGVPAAIITVETIGALEGGEDLAAKVRAAIGRYYREHGTAFVLLASDAHATKGVPARCLYAEFVWEGREFAQDLPADVYYACLDGGFNSDGDGHYGEPGDGPAGDDVDLYAEVAVGRAPVDTAAELAGFVRKTRRAYAIADENTRKKVLFAGEKLFPGIYGCQYMGEVEKGAPTHGFTTVGVSPGWDVDHLFDKTEQGVKTWRSTDLLAKLNGGAYLVHHIGHAATWMMMRLYSSHMSRLKAADPFLVYTQGCQCGRFTKDDCVAEKLFNAPKGAFAVLSNSHYGLGPEDPDDDATVVCRGASQYFHRQFVDGHYGEGIRRLGLLNQDSKEDNIPWMHHGTTRWVFWEMNLMGCPHLPLVK